MKRWATWITTAVIVLELSAALLFILARPQWAKTVLRAQYVWLWNTSNRITGNDFPPPDRFK